jgi:hypothetical protein
MSGLADIEITDRREDSKNQKWPDEVAAEGKRQDKCNQGKYDTKNENGIAGGKHGRVTPIRRAV